MSDHGAEPTLLQREANILRDLLRRFREDSSFLAASGARIIYFIDAHDLDSYIAPDKPDVLNGFLFEAENASNDPQTVADCAFKSEQILQRLLFDGDSPVGLLPSHGEEIQDHIAYHAAHYQRETLDLILAAQQEFRKLNQSPIARQLLTQIRKGTEATAQSRQDASKLLEKFAPALMTYLSKHPKYPRARIQALIDDSRLVGLAEFPWEQLSIAPPQAAFLRTVRPTEEEVFRWRRFLDESDARRERSNNANRIDAEALACMASLSAQLQKWGRSDIRIVLVTRVMSLFRATRNPQDLKAADLSVEPFLRHPRMIFLPGADAKLSVEVMDVLEVALNTFEEQLIAQGEQAAKKVEAARQIFVKALHDFERAQFALKLRTEVTPGEAAQEEVGQHVRKLLEWFADDGKFDAVIREDAAASVRHFGYETFALGSRDGREPIEALLRELDSPPRVSIRPIVAGVPGPVEFTARELQGKERECEDLEGLIGDLRGDHTERYLAWSLLHACRNRWELAKIYAQSALRVARLGHAKSHDSAVDETLLLLAQMHRLGGPESGGDRAEEAAKRFHEASRLLQASRAGSDARVLQEQAAQVLECCLAGGASTHLPTGFLQGITALMRAKELGAAQSDELVEARSLGQLLVFVLASQRRELDWPLEKDAVAMAKEWHGELSEIMIAVRSTRAAEEIPRRLLAMQLIGYRLTREDEADFYQPPHTLLRGRRAPDLKDIPAELLHGARELHLQLSRARDQIGRLIALELEQFVGPQDRYRQWELIYAPVWPPHHAHSVVRRLQGCTGAKQAAEHGYALLSSVIGPTELGVDPMHRRAFDRSGRWLAAAIDALRNEQGLADTDSRVLELRMDHCYARILLSVVTADPAVKRSDLLRLAADYEQLALDAPESAMVHFRLHVIYSELQELARSAPSQITAEPLKECEPEELGALRRRSHRELEAARELIDNDPFMALIPGHWILSTIQRRLALPLFDRAKAIRQKLRQEGVFIREIHAYKELLQQSFQIQYTGFSFDDIPDERADEFRRLELERRINNLVYAASLLLEVHGDLGQLHPQFNRERLERLIARLNPGGIESVQSESIAHTIGFAHNVLGNSSAALAAGEHLMRLIYSRGLALSARPHIMEVMEDALEWRRAAEYTPKGQAIS